MLSKMEVSKKERNKQIKLILGKSKKKKNLLINKWYLHGY